MDPPLKGVVIITLPPADDPSQGKTITAFTVSAEPRLPQPQLLQQLERSEPSATQSTALSRASSYSSRRRSRRRAHVFGFLGVSLSALFVWVFLFSDSSFDMRKRYDDDDDDGSQLSSFVFPLYPKSARVDGFQRDAELKLGRFVRRSYGAFRDRLKTKKKLKMASSASVNSSAMFPVKGNAYPDGRIKWEWKPGKVMFWRAPVRCLYPGDCRPRPCLETHVLLYYTVILVGSPPRPYYLDMDTGSDLTWIQCDAPCTSCAQGPHPLYKPSRKNILNTEHFLCTEVQGDKNGGGCESCEQCDYEIVYADQSSSLGVLARDDLLAMFTNETLAKSKFVFGCAYDQQGQLLVSPAKTDGVLGLGKSPISLPSQLANQGLISNVVGHCVSADANGDGYMFFGDYPVDQERMTWVPMLNSPLKYYQTEITKISYGSKQLNAVGFGARRNSARLIFDSGSSYTYFAKEAYASLIASIKDINIKYFVQDQSDPTLPVCWAVNFPIRSVKDVEQFFKPVIIRFNNRWWARPTTLVIPPGGFLIMNDKGNVCLGILDGSEVQEDSTVILGDISMRGQLVVYDNVKQKIGWVLSDCVKPEVLKNIPIF